MSCGGSATVPSTDPGFCPAAVTPHTLQHRTGCVQLGATGSANALLALCSCGQQQLCCNTPPVFVVLICTQAASVSQMCMAGWAASCLASPSSCPAAAAATTYCSSSKTRAHCWDVCMDRGKQHSYGELKCLLTEVHYSDRVLHASTDFVWGWCRDTSMPCKTPGPLLSWPARIAVCANGYTIHKSQC